MFDQRSDLGLDLARDLAGFAFQQDPADLGMLEVVRNPPVARVQVGVFETKGCLGRNDCLVISADALEGERDEQQQRRCPQTRYENLHA